MSPAEVEGAIETSLGRAGLKMARMVPLSEGDVQLTSATSRTALATWLAGIERELGARATSVVVTGRKNTRQRRRRTGTALGAQIELYRCARPLPARRARRTRCDDSDRRAGATAGRSGASGDPRPRRAGGRSRQSLERVGRAGTGAAVGRAGRGAREPAGAPDLATQSMAAHHRSTGPDAVPSVCAAHSRSPIRAPLFGGGATTLGATTVRLPAHSLSAWSTVEHAAPGGILALNWDRLQIAPGHLDGNFSRGMAIRLERAYTGVADGPLPPQRRTASAGNSAGITNHFGSPRAEGHWHNSRGWARTLFGPRPGSARHRPRCKSTTDGPISLLGRRDGEGALLNFGGG